MPCTRINAKWIEELNIRLETTKILEKNNSKISDIAWSSVFSDTTSQARKAKEKVNKWDYIKLKYFCTEKEPSTK